MRIKDILVDAKDKKNPENLVDPIKKRLLDVMRDKDIDIEFDKQQAQYETPISVSSKIPVSTEGNIGDRRVVTISHDSYFYIKVAENKWMKIQLEEL